MNYILKYREPGKRPGTTRWAKRRVQSVREAVQWMNINPEVAFLPAFVDGPGDLKLSPSYPMTDTNDSEHPFDSVGAIDLEQIQQEDALFPWLADGSMADPLEEFYQSP